MIIFIIFIYNLPLVSHRYIFCCYFGLYSNTLNMLHCFNIATTGADCGTMNKTPLSTIISTKSLMTYVCMLYM